MTVPDHIKSRLAELTTSLFAQAPAKDAPDLRWAHRIVAKHRSGLSVKQATLQIARDALAGKKAP